MEFASYLESSTRFCYHGVISGDANDEPPSRNDDAGTEPGCEHGRAARSNATLLPTSAATAAGC